MVATPRATIVNQLKKGTVQLNVLQREEKESNISSNAHSTYNKNMLRNNVGMSQEIHAKFNRLALQEENFTPFWIQSVKVRKNLDVEKHFLRTSSFTYTFNYNF